MREVFRPSAASSAFVAVAVRMALVLPLMIEAGRSTGATDAQTASFVIAACLAMAVESLFLSARHHMPIVCATTAAGIALVAQSAGYNVHALSAAYIMSGVFLTLTGVFRPFTHLVSRIPAGVSAGMLAGVLLGPHWLRRKVWNRLIWPLRFPSGLGRWSMPPVSRWMMKGSVLLPLSRSRLPVQGSLSLVLPVLFGGLRQV